MDEIKSFLEHPLDRSLYKPKVVSREKKPLRILVTEAGSKAAYNLIYKICSGSVFGPDQEIILHLVNSRGVLHHKIIILELFECGFPCFKDFVISSNPAVAFKNVDIVIAICTFEEISGLPVSGTIVYQAIRALHLSKEVGEHASKDCKIIFTGSATKAVTVMMSAFQKFHSYCDHANISGVTYFDVVISKALLAAKLRTTTDRIKNVIIWSATCPDVRNATVRMYPANDHGTWEMKEIPIRDAIQDEEWLHTTFLLSVYRRVLNNDLLSHGKAIALSTAHHLKVLFEGSENFDEIPSMAVIIPSIKPYDLPPGFGFSCPVTTKNGKWQILKNVPMDVPTQLNAIKIVHKVSEKKIKEMLVKIVSFMLEYDITKKQMSHFFPHKLTEEIMEIRKWTAQYYVHNNPAEGVEKINRTKSSSRKSIVWDDAVSSIRNYTSIKSSIRFSGDMLHDNKRNSKISSN